MAIYNLSNEAYLSFHTFSYYIDLNRYTSYEYIATDKDEPVKKEITKVSNEKTISSDYLMTSKDGTLDFCLGGKTNLLDLNAYKNGDDIKYIPSDDNTKLPYTLTINDKEYDEIKGLSSMREMKFVVNRKFLKKNILIYPLL